MIFNAGQSPHTCRTVEAKEILCYKMILKLSGTEQGKHLKNDKILDKYKLKGYFYSSEKRAGISREHNDDRVLRKYYLT